MPGQHPDARARPARPGPPGPHRMVLTSRRYDPSLDRGPPCVQSLLFPGVSTAAGRGKCQRRPSARPGVRPPEGGSAARSAPPAQGRVASRRAPPAPSCHGPRRTPPPGLRPGEAGQPRRRSRPGRAQVRDADRAGPCGACSRCPPVPPWVGHGVAHDPYTGYIPTGGHAGHRGGAGPQWSPSGKPALAARAAQAAPPIWQRRSWPGQSPQRSPRTCPATGKTSGRATNGHQRASARANDH